ncbi:MAG: biopolymer transporter ExbD [Gemmatimonadetes bacterium]|nr:biopolymer transporter ExbD [Gemmatimonadota bacterium]MYA64652.1 biopolymer transporter ExbD [Gemmatimonadota bacterium]MYB99374.1 biopolymer transporter ExbD [Gemmatimonadota bacterium]MYH51989.1 biopolymer transporter ExbD [Gemmatimonadota bacterium]MYI46842.1 biopolymer transporter ExbD [Gemmatimonadota bacterium]
MTRRDRQRNGLPVRAEINVTSLVDVAFTLLIIFIITAPVLQGGIEVNLPEGPVQVVEATDDQIIVAIDETGLLHIGDAPVADDLFDVTLQELIEERNADLVLIKGDSAAVFGRVARALAGIAPNNVRASFIMREFRR